MGDDHDHDREAEMTIERNDYSHDRVEGGGTCGGGVGFAVVRL